MFCGIDVKPNIMAVTFNQKKGKKNFLSLVLIFSCISSLFLPFFRGKPSLSGCFSGNGPCGDSAGGNGFLIWSKMVIFKLHKGVTEPE